MSQLSLVCCKKVFVNRSVFENGGLGAFAACNIKQGELIEQGVARLVDCDGNNNPFLFTWSDDRTKWAFASGCAPFYNTSLTPNTEMYRDFSANTFQIYALKDINAGEELTHTYRSLTWRKCFTDLNNNLSGI